MRAIDLQFQFHAPREAGHKYHELASLANAFQQQYLSQDKKPGVRFEPRRVFESLACKYDGALRSVAKASEAAALLRSALDNAQLENGRLEAALAARAREGAPRASRAQAPCACSAAAGASPGLASDSGDGFKLAASRLKCFCLLYTSPSPRDS